MEIVLSEAIQIFFAFSKYLGGGSRHGFFLLDIVIGTDFTGNNGVGLLADSSDLIVAVVVVHNVLHVQDNGGGLGGEGGDTDLSVDGGVGVPAVELGGVSVPVSRGSGGDRGGEGDHNESLDRQL